VGITTSLAAAWIYDNFFNNQNRFEFLDKSPFSVALRQCYSVPEGKSRIVTIPTMQLASNLPAEKVNLRGYLSDNVAIVDFATIKRLYKSGHISIYKKQHLTEVRNVDTKKSVASFKATGISAFDMDARELSRVEIGFSKTGSLQDLHFGKGALSPVESGKCAIINIVLLN